MTQSSQVWNIMTYTAFLGYRGAPEKFGEEKQ
jgi:hypothetical protein